MDHHLSQYSGERESTVAALCMVFHCAYVLLDGWYMFILCGDVECHSWDFILQHLEFHVSFDDTHFESSLGIHVYDSVEGLSHCIALLIVEMFDHAKLYAPGCCYEEWHLADVHYIDEKIDCLELFHYCLRYLVDIALGGCPGS